MLLAEVVAVSTAVASTRARREKTRLLADALRLLGPDEWEAGVAYLSGELRQRQIGVGWAAVREVPPAAETASLTVAEVDSACERIGATTGAGSQANRRELLSEMFGRATLAEQEYLRRLLTGELRQGALAGVMAEAIAAAVELPAAAVRRALLLSGDLRQVAVAAFSGGSAALAAIGLVVGRPLSPMLAGSAPDIATAMAKTGPAALEWKLDGIRVQVHRDGDEVAVFTRSLDDVTSRLPELVTAVRAFNARSLVLDGEALALDETGRPHPFQVTASRTGTRRVDGGGRIPLTSTYFDILHLDGTDLLDERADRRWAALAEVVPAEARIRRTLVEDTAAAEAAYAEALDAGHEGAMIKALDATYQAGRRGSGWLKVKPRHTLDLVVLAAEWGHGRRRGWLSNLHLGARDPDSGFVMLGKTFKGLTDEMLTEQTARLRELAVDDGEWVVTVRPELVVEIAFDGVQTSTRYPGGVALRFARVVRYRPDKTPADADTIDAVRAIHQGSVR